MRIVVAGSSGLIGTSLVAALRQAEHEVIRLVRRAPKAPDERGWAPHQQRVDANALDGADTVVNLCGAGIGNKRWSAGRKQELFDSRLLPTSLLAQTVAERGVPILINGSGVDFYGDTGELPVTEATAAGSSFLAELCRRWEAATAPASEAGVRVALLRSGPVLSPSGGVLGQIRPLFTFMLGGRLGNGRQYFPWISLDDEVGAIRFILENPEIAGPVNLTGPDPVTNAEFTKALAKAIGRPAPWVVPAFALRTALGDMADMILHSHRVVPTVLEKHGYVFQHATVSAALSTAVAG